MQLITFIFVVVLWKSIPKLWNVSSWIFSSSIIYQNINPTISLKSNGRCSWNGCPFRFNFLRCRKCTKSCNLVQWWGSACFCRDKSGGGRVEAVRLGAERNQWAQEEGCLGNLASQLILVSQIQNGDNIFPAYFPGLLCDDKIKK